MSQWSMNLNWIICDVYIFIKDDPLCLFIDIFYEKCETLAHDSEVW